ncbi:conserved hypothetical protein [Psychromonas ingrahamii 37]|uniref:DUF2158 domain-containing protein n=1 Tax=Psychromonas ingrahamii (strain DSM 17664 / CCUG 51855 / 37) TaxID=357804 RepID=A1SX55_PSYIN|nr:YodC family protein [Psychromonas ingrahamii]ABM04070.1 conserved hypothetical protein [Psychromonas ingrahamii 37]
MINIYSTGDVVKLKSGGPEMTVNKVFVNIDDEFTGNYECQWFAGDKLDEGIFPEESLVEVTAEE